MKKTTIILLLALVGCGKSNLWVPPGYPEITETWIVVNGHDTAFYSASFCKWNDGTDTVKLKYTQAPTDPHRYGYFKDDIVVDRIPMGEDLFDRNYKLLNVKLNNQP